MMEEPGEHQGAAAKQPSKIVGKLITVAIIVLIAVIAGLATYLFVLKPMLEEEATPTGEGEEIIDDVIPAGAVAVDFPEKMAAAKPDTQDSPSSVLQYVVSVICANEETRLLVDANRQWFEAKFDELHRGRTKSELNDPQVERSISRQMVEEANSILRRLQAKPNPEVRVINVLHLKYAVFDL